MQALGLDQTRRPAPLPELLVKLPSWPRVFFGNLRDLILPQRIPRLELRSAPAPFWPDVFVKRGLPWFGFLQSGACHFLAFVLLLALTRFLAWQPYPTPHPPAFDHSQVIYYSASEYLPPLDTREDTRVAQPDQPAKADPAFSPQPIISVPRESDNRSQTIVTPPSVKLKHDVALPNIVAWSDKAKPRLAIPAAPLTPAADITRMAPQMKDSVVAPPPEAAHLAHRREQPKLQASVVAPPPDLRPSRTAAFEAPQPAVVAPPPEVESAPVRSLGELNIGHSPVIDPAPQLPVGDQRAVAGGRSAAVAVAPPVVPPPPSVSAGESYGSPGRVIALNLHPAVAAPPDLPQGNRRGTFAATPEGHPGAMGAPGSSSGATVAGSNGHGSGGGKGNEGRPSGKETNGIPTGLYVGNAPPSARTSAVAGDPASPNASPVADPSPAASVRPRVGNVSSHLQPGNAANLPAVERAVFAARRFYSLTLNMPNLNSAGGSWVIRFAELKQDSDKHGADYLASNSPEGELAPPVVTRKVDPAYPMQLMRQNVAGTVILYAIIHADGTVGNVRVLQSVDPRLDRFAADAIAQWQFQPATKNGSPVDVEATFQIPFRPPRNF